MKACLGRPLGLHHSGQMESLSFRHPYVCHSGVWLSFPLWHSLFPFMRFNTDSHALTIAPLELKRFQSILPLGKSFPSDANLSHELSN